MGESGIEGVGRMMLLMGFELYLCLGLCLLEGTSGCLIYKYQYLHVIQLPFAGCLSYLMEINYVPTKVFVMTHNCKGQTNLCVDS